MESSIISYSLNNLITKLNINDINMEQFNSIVERTVSLIIDRSPELKEKLFQFIDLVFGPKHLLGQVCLIVILQTGM
jgi:hypothetical protein